MAVNSSSAGVGFCFAECGVHLGFGVPSWTAAAAAAAAGVELPEVDFAQSLLPQSSVPLVGLAFLS